MKLVKSKKGFTLIEIIVVLVILAILAAAAIPTMLGFVNDAKGKALIAQARAAYVGAQMIATEKKAATPGIAAADLKKTIVETDGTIKADGRMYELLKDDIDTTKILIDVTFNATAGGNGAKITTFKYLDKDADKQVNITTNTTADGKTTGGSDVIDNNTDALK